MVESRLFFGFAATPSFLEEVAQKDAYTVALFLGGTETYLTRLTIEGEEWIGKFLPLPFDLRNLEPLGANIYSLAKRLVPAFEEAPLFVKASGYEEAARVSP